MDVITFPKNLKTSSGLSIEMHGVISFIDETSYDNNWSLDRHVFKCMLNLYHKGLCYSLRKCSLFSFS